MFEWMKAGSSPWGPPASAPVRLFFIGSLFLTVSPLLILLGMPLAAQAQPFTRSFHIAPGTGEVEVINQIGTIRIISTDTRSDRISVHAKRLSGDSRINSLQNSSGKVIIEVGGRGTVEIEVVVPAVARLDLLTYKGNIEVSNHIGQIRARIVSDGDIFFTGLRSTNVEGHSHYGNVHFSGVPVNQGDYRFKSFAGRLDVKFPSNADFKLSAATHQGGLDLGDFPLKYDHQMSDIVEAVSGAGRSKVYLWTQEGQIRLHRLL
ncbi:MAG: DUF4097 family beta strand repeat-containing protein [Acidobacteriota bacterium]|jgi:hypothetical protein